MIRTGTVSKVRYADSDTVASVAVEDGPATDRALCEYDAYESEYLLPAQDPNYPQFTTTEAEVTTSVEDVMKLLIYVAQKTGLEAAYTHSIRGAAVASPFIISGGILLGPVGIFIGGAVGGFIGWMISKDFKPVPQILMELPAAEKQKLYTETMAALKNVKLRGADATYLINLVMSNSTIRGKVSGVLTTYITKMLKAKPMHRK